MWSQIGEFHIEDSLNGYDTVEKRKERLGIESSIVMYILFVGAALVMGALSAIIFMNIYRKNHRAGLLVGILSLLWIVYQVFTLANLSISLAITVVVIFLFFWIAAYRKLRAEGVSE